MARRHTSMVTRHPVSVNPTSFLQDFLSRKIVDTKPGQKTSNIQSSESQKPYDVFFGGKMPKAYDHSTSAGTVVGKVFHFNITTKIKIAILLLCDSCIKFLLEKVLCGIGIVNAVYSNKGHRRTIFKNVTSFAQCHLSAPDFTNRNREVFCDQKFSKDANSYSAKKISFLLCPELPKNLKTECPWQ